MYSTAQAAMIGTPSSLSLSAGGFLQCLLILESNSSLLFFVNLLKATPFTQNPPLYLCLIIREQSTTSFSHLGAIFLRRFWFCLLPKCPPRFFCTIHSWSTFHQNFLLDVSAFSNIKRLPGRSISSSLYFELSPISDEAWLSIIADRHTLTSSGLHLWQMFQPVTR